MYRLKLLGLLSCISFYMAVSGIHQSCHSILSALVGAGQGHWTLQAFFGGLFYWETTTPWAWLVALGGGAGTTLFFLPLWRYAQRTRTLDDLPTEAILGIIIGWQAGYSLGEMAWFLGAPQWPAMIGGTVVGVAYPYWYYMRRLKDWLQATKGET